MSNENGVTTSLFLKPIKLSWFLSLGGIDRSKHNYANYAQASKRSGGTRCTERERERERERSYSHGRCVRMIQKKYLRSLRTNNPSGLVVVERMMKRMDRLIVDRIAKQRGSPRNGRWIFLGKYRKNEAASAPMKKRGTRSSFSLSLSEFSRACYARGGNERAGRKEGRKKRRRVFRESD